MIHAHEILHMMEGNSYTTKQSLIDAIVERFGTNEQFYACSVEGLNATEIVDFLETKGKFKPTEKEAFTVDITKVCNH